MTFIFGRGSSSSSSSSHSDAVQSLSENEDERIRDACIMLRLPQKELRVTFARMSELKNAQLAFVMSQLEPPFGIRDVTEMGGDLVPWIKMCRIVRGIH